MEETKPCRSCTAPIPTQALRCPECRARQPQPLHRGGHRMVGGVCGMLADQLAIDPTLVRIITAALATLSFGMVFGLYLLLWVVTPPALRGRSPLTRLVDWLNALFGSKPAAVNPPVAQRVS